MSEYSPPKRRRRIPPPPPPPPAHVVAPPPKPLAPLPGTVVIPMLDYLWLEHDRLLQLTRMRVDELLVPGTGQLKREREDAIHSKAYTLATRIGDVMRTGCRPATQSEEQSVRDILNIIDAELAIWALRVVI